MIKVGNLIIKPNRFPHVKKIPGVYMLTCKNTGKSYIGSSVNVNYRLSQYTNKAYKKHLNEIDFDHCEFKVLEYCQYLSVADRLKVELESILKYNTVYPNGFNKRDPITGFSFDNKNIEKAFILKQKRKAKKGQPKGETDYGKPPKLYKNVIKY